MFIIGVLIALALPALERARGAARKSQCLNNLRNLTFGLTQHEQIKGRFPASGNYGQNAAGKSREFHNWVISILPWIEQQNLANQWDTDLPIISPQNQPLTQTRIPVLICSEDLSARGGGDLSYAVNGGVGYTIRNGSGVEDCPVDTENSPLDLNGNGITCPTDPELDPQPTDRDLFKAMGMFFLETWKSDITVRHHSLDDVIDGTSQTILLTENVRTGVDPLQPKACFASSTPKLCAFYMRSPCVANDCTVVDYSRSNAGTLGINQGLRLGEGVAPGPNSFHPGGVHFAFVDGHVRFVSESLDGKIYAALITPQGRRLDGSPLAQAIVGEF